MGAIAILTGIVYAAVAIGLIYRFGREEGYYSTITVFAIGCTVYYVAIPFDLAIRHFADQSTPTSFAVILSDGQLAWIIVMATLALVAWVVGYKASGFKPWMSPEWREADQDTSVPLSVIVLVPVAAALLAGVLYFGHFLPGLRNYVSSGDLVVYENPILALLLAACYVPLALIGTVWLRGRRRRPAAIGIAGALSAASIFINRKEAMSLAFLMIASPFTRRSLRPIQAAVILAGAVAAGLLAFNAYSLHRGGAELTVQSVLTPSYGLIEGSDAGGPFGSIQYVFGSPRKLQFGASYLDIAYLMVPKAIWPGRPLDLAEQFARDTIPNWVPGRGRGFSLLAEAYLNLGSVGVLLQYLVLGYGWGFFWNWLRRLLSVYSQGAWEALYSTLGFLTLLTLHRGPVATGVKTLFVMILPLVIASLVVDRGPRIYRAFRAPGTDTIDPGRTPAGAHES